MDSIIRPYTTVSLERRDVPTERHNYDQIRDHRPSVFRSFGGSYGLTSPTADSESSLEQGPAVGAEGHEYSVLNISQSQREMRQAAAEHEYAELETVSSAGEDLERDYTPVLPSRSEITRFMEERRSSRLLTTRNKVTVIRHKLLSPQARPKSAVPRLRAWDVKDDDPLNLANILDESRSESEPERVLKRTLTPIQERKDTPLPGTPVSLEDDEEVAPPLLRELEDFDEQDNPEIMSLTVKKSSRFSSRRHKSPNAIGPLPDKPDSCLLHPFPHLFKDIN